MLKFRVYACILKSLARNKLRTQNCLFMVKLREIGKYLSVASTRTFDRVLPGTTNHDSLITILLRRIVCTHSAIRYPIM